MNRQCALFGTPSLAIGTLFCWHEYGSINPLIVSLVIYAQQDE
jgi:hypothetical protein